MLSLVVRELCDRGLRRIPIAGTVLVEVGGGTPNSFDRVLATRLATYAVKTAAEDKFGNMVALKTPDITLVPLEKLAGIVRHAPCQPASDRLVTWWTAWRDQGTPVRVGRPSALSLRAISA